MCSCIYFSQLSLSPSLSLSLSASLSLPLSLSFLATHLHFYSFTHSHFSYLTHSHFYYLSLMIFASSIDKMPQICTVILRICIGKVAVYICGNFWFTQYLAVSMCWLSIYLGWVTLWPGPDHDWSIRAFSIHHRWRDLWTTELSESIDNLLGY